MKRIIFIFWRVISLFSCSLNKDYTRQVEAKLKDLDNNPIGSYSFIIIIPEEGCSGCISEAEDFYMNNKERQDLFFIFTNISSIKSIKLRVGKDIKDKKNVFLDLDNDFLSEQFNENIYPIVFDIRNKDNITYRFLEPGIDLQIKSPKE